MSEMETKTAEIIRDLAERKPENRLHEISNPPSTFASGVRDVTGLVLKNDEKWVDLSEVMAKLRDRPLRKGIKAQLKDFDSFAKMLSLVGMTTNTVVYYDTETRCMCAVLDDYTLPAADPRWRDDRVTLTMELSEELSLWKSKNGAQQSQSAFAEFIEDNIDDVVTPGMLEAVTAMDAKVGVDFSSAIRLENGTVDFVYKESISGADREGRLNVPQRFKIGVRVFAGDNERLPINCRLRYQVARDGLKFRYLMDAIDLAIEMDFMQRVDQLRARGFNCVHGKP